MICYSTDRTQLNENQRKEYEFKTRFHQDNNLDTEIRKMYNQSTWRVK